MDRRDFLKSTAVTAGLALSGGLVAAADKKTYRAGLIGTGWYGMVDMRHLMDNCPNLEVVAMCDVDRKNLKEATDEVAGRQKDRPAEFHDFRDMLKPKNLDIVLI